MYPGPHVHKVAFDRGSSGHHRTYQMGATLLTLATFKVPVGSAGTALASRYGISISGNAHAASSVTPLESGSRENLVKSFPFRLRPHPAGTGNNQSLFDGR